MTLLPLRVAGDAIAYASMQTKAGDPARIRPDSAHFYFAGLDGLRFLAFLSVFFIHLPAVPDGNGGTFDLVLAGLQRCGWIGVDLFFVLSAYLMTTLLMLEGQSTGGISIKNFYLRRIYRIWPLYFFAIAVAFAIVPLFPGRASPPFGSPQYLQTLKTHLPALLLFFDNVMNIVSAPANALVAPLWSISSEEQFYLLLPLLVSVLLKAPRRVWIGVLAGIFLFSFLARTALMQSGAVRPTVVWVVPFVRADSFLAGMLIAWLHVSGRLPAAWKQASGAVFTVGVVLLAAAAFSPHHLDRDSIGIVWKYTIVSAACGLLVLSVVLNGLSLPSRLLAWKPLVAAGKISFGLYVYHYLAIAWTGDAADRLASVARDRVGDWASWLTLAACALAFTYAVAWLSYRFLERPFLLRKRRLEAIRSRTP